jgi:hypothetical protein
LIEAVLALAKSEPGTAALNLDELTNVVGSEEPFQRTMELETKPVPVRVKVKEAVPGLTAPGTIGSN